MNHDVHTSDIKHGTFKSYIVGFILSIVLTIVAYFLVAEKMLTNWTLVLTIVGLAVVQVLVQLLFFLHLDKEAKPRWNLLIFLFMMLVVAILLGGSLWIMSNLNERVMPPMDMDTYMFHEEGIKKL